MTTVVGQVVVWWLVIQALGLVGLPLTRVVFRWLPDRGYAFSKSLGLLLTGYGAWVLAMLGLGSFGVPLLVLVALLVAGLGMGCVQPLKRSNVQTFKWFPCWRLIVGYEALFLGALVFVAWLRAHNPDPWGTERPMDYAFLNAIRNSSSFPPQDPWLAGYSINYYYFGYLLMAVMGRLSGLDFAVAYNLALALTFALTALGVVGILVNLLALTPVRRAGLPRMTPLVLVLGVTLVLIAGNQAGALQVIVGNERVVALDGQQLLAALGQAAQGREVIALPHPVKAADFGEFSTLERYDRVNDFNWWWPSRALWDDYTAQGRARQYTITEFPFFSFWLGDLHPHVMALPGGLLALALALATLARPTLPRFAQECDGWTDLLLTGLILGSLYVINSWDMPTYVLLYAGVLLLKLGSGDVGEQGAGSRERGAGNTAHRPASRTPLFAPRLLLLQSVQAALPAQTAQTLLRQGGLVLVTMIGLFLPFYLTFHAPVGAAAPLIDLPLVGRITQIIGPVTGVKSGLHAFLIIFGLFCIPLGAFVYLSTWPHPSPTTPSAVEGDQDMATPVARRWSVAASIAWFPLLLLLVGMIVGFPLLALAGLGALAIRQALRMPERPAEVFVLLVVTLGCAISIGTELIYIRDVFEGLSPRMNTIFKFFYQIWLLWGTVTAYALWWLMTQTGHRQRIITATIGGLSLVLLLGGLVYPAINLRNTWQHGTFVGLHGKTPREATPAGQASIRWLRAHVPPGSVVLEMVDPQGGSYNGAGFGGVSASTGLPTVLGWVGHQHQWRGGDTAARAEIAPRQTDVDRIYRTQDLQEARDLLARYHVAYVYIGALERQHYSPDSLAKFADLGRVVFAMDEVTIYALSLQ